MSVINGDKMIAEKHGVSCNWGEGRSWLGHIAEFCKLAFKNVIVFVQHT